MLRYALKRLLGAIPLLLGVTALIFILLESAPGSPADLLLGSGPVPPEVRQRIEEIHGLDRSDKHRD